MPNLIELGLRLEAIGTALVLLSGFIWIWTRKVRMDRRRRTWGKV